MIHVKTKKNGHQLDYIFVSHRWKSKSCVRTCTVDWVPSKHRNLHGERDDAAAAVELAEARPARRRGVVPRAHLEARRGAVQRVDGEGLGEAAGGCVRGAALPKSRLERCGAGDDRGEQCDA